MVIRFKVERRGCLCRAERYNGSWILLLRFPVKLRSLRFEPGWRLKKPRSILLVLVVALSVIKLCQGLGGSTVSSTATTHGETDHVRYPLPLVTRIPVDGS